MCICQKCNRKYKVDLIIPNFLWDKIKPKNKKSGQGLLCGSCIMKKIENLDEYNSFEVKVTQERQI